MKKSLLFIKALIIVVWSAQVSLAEEKKVTTLFQGQILSDGKLLTSGFVSDDLSISIFSYNNRYYKCEFNLRRGTIDCYLANFFIPWD